MTIAVMGCLPTMPEAFPLEYPENAGNMIHGRAPFAMFDDCVFYQDTRFRLSGYTKFAEFANACCSHLVVTIANLLLIGDTDGSKYASFQHFLESIDIPIVVFGLGAQSKTHDLQNASMPSEAVALMQYLGKRCEVVGVRGPFTKEVFRHFAEVTNVYVTGCPSFFQRPEKFADLREAVRSGKLGRPSYSGTVLHREDETEMLIDAIEQDTFLVEPVNKFNHAFHLACARGDTDPEIPWYLRKHVGPDKRLSRRTVSEYYRANYRLFRHTQEWYAFNTECVSYTYGTRFHVNMASILSGVPAVWVTHDSRTDELTDFLHLPSVPLETATQMTTADYPSLFSQYEELFDNLSDLYANFNEYLSIFELPTLTLKF
ncbi:polysaccharide pyruvyl transferase family protein [Kocuria sp. CPCC 205261]|uniref:polysaccharide pyruvyl transferase family protein n=1 Tax=Kocuria sp. CPCC 205261 TaxID=3073554 RepID=UPI0034D7B31C